METSEKEKPFHEIIIEKLNGCETKTDLRSVIELIDNELNITCPHLILEVYELRAEKLEFRSSLVKDKLMAEMGFQPVPTYFNW